jgi:hypothetical protein
MTNKKLEEIARKNNARIIPEVNGYVRYNGPRRQYKAKVVNGTLVYKEI